MSDTVRYYATGRRKTSVAKVWLRPGVGKFSINRRLGLEDYFQRETLVKIVKAPLQVTDNMGRFDVIAQLKGGGKSGQAGALSHGIARALVEANATLRSPLKSAGLLTRDPRKKERKKYGQPGARKKFQFSKR
ncbi:MAG: 30S ribosomal protein S9 [Candidatus Euphemobacter frigidus]|nr:30S ribosomal protein S9 [Candidatus Euphemobacter frigidus]MDP8274865.1 30S ribosomal protein S9 [Candidatus Euphemobacter frigidus]